MPLDVQSVREQLPGRRIEWRESIGSTMQAAAALAGEGCPSGTVVGADEQTAGHGRHGNTWHSEPDAGLYVSIVLRYPFSSDTLPLVTLALGLAAQEAILKAIGFACDLRWPNDLLANGRKCGGILAHLEASAIVAGLGINVNHGGFPPELGALATSLRIATGREQSRERLLVELLPSVDAFCYLLSADGPGPILEAFTHASTYVRGRRVSVDQGDVILHGITEGLDPSGFLLLRDDHGKQHVIITGGVRPCS
jgi:BirA family biotin operon repressor/biotin-[acetyl-CoA-carboxylase] ligase